MSVRRNSKYIKIITIIILIFVFSSGCSAYKNPINDKKEINLTNRQKEIFQEANLPSDYSKLSLTQKNAIMSIEEMLVYLEEKYDEKFIYFGYVPEGAMDKEHLLACRADMSSEEQITVYRDIQGEKTSFSDDYLDILAKPIYEETIHEYIQKFFESEDYQLFIDVDVFREDFNKETILENVSASLCIMFDASKCDNIKLKEFTNDYSLWMLEKSKKSISSSGTFCRIESNSFKQLNKYNYEEYLRNKNVGENIIVSISESGKINII